MAVRGVPVRSSYYAAPETCRETSVSASRCPTAMTCGSSATRAPFDAMPWVAGGDMGSIDGSSALEARYRRGSVPHGGDYPSGVPARFIPVPTNVYLPDGSGRECTRQSAAYPAGWPTGLAVLASNRSEVLVSYAEVCVTRPLGGGAVPARVGGLGLHAVQLANSPNRSGPRRRLQAAQKRCAARRLEDLRLSVLRQPSAHALRFALHLAVRRVCQWPGVVGHSAGHDRRDGQSRVVQGEAAGHRPIPQVGTDLDFGRPLRHRLPSHRDDIGRRNIQGLRCSNRRRPVAPRPIGHVSLGARHTRDSVTPSWGIPS